MPILLFTVGPSAVGQLHDMLACLAKFSEDVSLEATQSELRISSLNISKTAHAAFTLSGNRFFDKYHFSPDQRGLSTPKAWTCKLQNRALASAFRKRNSDVREKDTALEKCEFELQARSDLPECRLIIRLICRFGVIKTYRLTYESGEILNASFDKIGSNNAWAVSSRTLRDIVEYFGPKTEQLDWYLKDGQVTFTSYTEKVQDGREILKQPMHTSVALKKKDFNECRIEEGLHIGIIVKDFRAIVAHSETLHATVNARYARGNRPMQISYEVEGLSSEFTLMTRGSSAISVGANTNTPARNLSVKPVTQSELEPRPTSTAGRTQTPTPVPPAASTHSRQQSVEPGHETSRRNTPPPSAVLNEESLFIPADDDDQQWDAPNYDDEQEFVTWDNGSGLADASTSMRRVRDSETNSYGRTDEPAVERPSNPLQEIAPTQRLSQVKGLFD